MANATAAATSPQSLTDRQRKRILLRAVSLGRRAAERETITDNEFGDIVSRWAGNDLELAIRGLDCYGWRTRDRLTPRELAIETREVQHYPNRTPGSPAYWMHQAERCRHLLRMELAGVRILARSVRFDAQALLRRYAAERAARRFA